MKLACTAHVLLNATCQSIFERGGATDEPTSTVSVALTTHYADCHSEDSASACWSTVCIAAS